jgi:DNA-binding transcriptional MerR regulator/methylmalonyl-CoA mutase cobalamin-binding subunit
MNQMADQDIDKEAIYNIGAVARMTGISIATLRAWEQRYGFPEAGRSPGGHRLYSEDDVQWLRWVRAQIDGGLRASQAIEALQHHKREILEQAAAERLPNEPLALPLFHQQLFQVLAAHDTAGADHILGEALLAHNLDDVMLDVIGPTLADVGQAWMDGRLDVATEHLATNYLRHRLETWAISSAPPHQLPPVVLACAPGELHEGGLLILATLLRRRRWPVVYLGQSVPLPDLAKLAGEIKPRAIVLSATLEESARALIELAKWLPTAGGTGRPIVAYGGRIFDQQPEWRARVPGTFLGETLREGLQALEAIMQRKGSGRA